MRNPRVVLPLFLFASMLLVPGTATDRGLDGFLDEIEIRASKDMGSFRADLSLTFDVSDRTIDGLFEIMDKASDVYMCLRLGEVTDQPIERVIKEHRMHARQGWGVIAKNLGIQPGSEEFHALKAGRLPSHAGGAPSAPKNNGKGRSKGRG